MHCEPESAGFLERFFNNFFQEKNIKWMLIVGAAIVFGSSLMLVTKAWPEWSFSLKYLTIVGYTGIIFGASEFARRQLKLNATYRVLQTLTMLLLPICFLSLSWLSSGTAVESISQLAWSTALLLPAMALLWVASTRILDHWLRGRQVSFLISFVLLCLAGAVPVISSPVMAFAFVMGCWIVFSIGVLKINRHTFWLAEKHQLPRVLGFLPIVMLGLQLIVLAGTKAVASLPPQWIGFATVLVATTILLTARSIADVYRRRTGDLVRPLPGAIVTPLFVGVLVAITGLALSLVGFSFGGPTSYAVVPTALVAAIAFGGVAWDIKDQWLVWASLIAVAIAYQCSPVLFADLVNTFKHATAEAINRDRVPLSLYGITYLPLLGGLSVVSFFATRHSLTEFSKPLQHFVTLIALVLFAFAAMDAVSLFIIASVNSVMFIAYAIAFRDRRYAAGSLVSLVLAVVFAIPAGRLMSYWFIDVDWIPTILAGLSVGMTCSRIPDRMINRIPLPDQENPPSQLAATSIGSRLTQTMGCTLALGVGIHWIAISSLSLEPLPTPMQVQFACLLVSMLIYTLRVPTYWTAMGCWILTAYAAIRSLLAHGVAPSELGVVVSLLMMVASVVAYRMTREHGAISVRLLVFARPLLDLSAVGLLLMLGTFFLPRVLSAHAWVTMNGWGSMDTWPQIDLGTGLPLFGLSVVTMAAWLTALALVRKTKPFGYLAAAAVPLCATTVLIEIGFSPTISEMLLVGCGVLSISLWIARAAIKRSNHCDHQEPSPGILAIKELDEGLLLLFAAVSCVSFDWSMRLVAVLAGLALWGNFSRSKQLQGLGDLSIVLSVQTLLAAAAMGGCHGWIPPGLLAAKIGPSLAYPLAGCVLWITLFELGPNCLHSKRTGVWCWFLHGMAMILMVGCLGKVSFDSLSVATIVISALLLMVSQITKGVRVALAERNRQDAYQVNSCEEDIQGPQPESGVFVAKLVASSPNRWAGETGICVAMVIAMFVGLFLYLQGVISFGVGISQFALLGLGISAFGVTEIARRFRIESAFERPMQWIGNAMPAVVAAMAIIREFTDTFASSTSLGSLALMIAAGIYFYRAIHTGRRINAFGGIAIANLGLILLWRSLGWLAPELYLVPIGISIFGMVEALKDKLPDVSHNPLRYVAVFTVMASPAFEVLGGSWVHMLVLMFISVFLILVAIGLRLRALIYAGTACLLVDLIAMVVRSTIHNLNLLWIAGVMLGIAVIALAAFCENHRDKLLARIRILSAELATWN